MNLQDTIAWCKENHARIDFTDNHVTVEADGFDCIIAETLQEAVELAVELEQQYTQPIQQTIPNPNWLPEEEELDEDPPWLPSAAEIEAAEIELTARELEESQQAYRDMVEDETRALKSPRYFGNVINPIQWNWW